MFDTHLHNMYNILYIATTHTYHSVNGVIFVASLSDYNCVLYEDSRVNAMLESVNVFEEVVNLKCFSKSSLILILNKDDIFREKLRRDKISLSTCFGQGCWPNESEYFPDEMNPSMTFATNEIFEDFHQQCVSFIRDIFAARYYNRDRHNMLSHVTTATENAVVARVLANVQHQIIANHLAAPGLITLGQDLFSNKSSQVANYTHADYKTSQHERDATVTNSKYSNFTLNKNQQIYDLVADHINVCHNDANDAKDNIFGINDENEQGHKISPEMVNADQNNLNGKTESIMSSFTKQRYVTHVNESKYKRKYDKKYINIYTLTLCSSLDVMKKYKIERALVAMIGIGCYPNGGVLGDLKGISQDYRNMIKLFVNHWGYSFIYETSDNKIEYLSKTKLLTNNKKYSTNFKIKWNENDITSFVQCVKKTILSTKPDSLIFVISSHGDRDQVIIDSEFEEYGLIEIYSQFWNSEYGCPYLCDKPKLFFIDACQGMKTPIPKGKNNKMKKLKTKGTTKMSDNELKLQAFVDEDDNDDNDKSISISSQTIDTKYLDYENFCYIYGNLDEYGVLDGGINGGYLIQSIKSVFGQKNANKQELNKLINLIAMETLRMVKGEKKQKNGNNNQKTNNNNPARQIVQYTSNIHCQLFFSKRNT